MRGLAPAGIASAFPGSTQTRDAACGKSFVDAARGEHGQCTETAAVARVSRECLGGQRAGDTARLPSRRRRRFCSARHGTAHNDGGSGVPDEKGTCTIRRTQLCPRGGYLWAWAHRWRLTHLVEQRLAVHAAIVQRCAMCVRHVTQRASHHLAILTANEAAARNEVESLRCCRAIARARDDALACPVRRSDRISCRR